jgi:hypothetical protein
MADAVVLAKRHDDPWTNLILAREHDVQLVVRDGRARYGTRPLMRSAGERATTAVRVGRTSRDVPLRRPGDPAAVWPWTEVMQKLQTVQADPVAAIAEGLAFETEAADVTTDPAVGLILESDMPGGPNSVAGPPPKGTQFDAPQLPSLVHDAAWFQLVRDAGYHDHLLDHLDKLFAPDAVLT